MTTRTDCARAEILAGAIALGEAGDAERDAYRGHLAGCGRCLADLGGEREIERVMAIALQAQSEERWEPDIRKAAIRRPKLAYVWKWSAALATTAILILAVRATQQQAVIPHPHAMVVVHNVVTLTPPARSTSAQEEHAIAALDTQTAPRREHRAESLVVGSATIADRDAMPLGGENGILPHPSAVAYDEHAEGTTAFEVRVDQRGLPRQCTITKSSGFPALDQSVCRAAMQARYSPRMVGGRAVAGIYRDAFTFRSSDTQ
ncbi:MAG: energy transducer TonB [Candidatus Cybelea sp.]|jgi:TonB family protein